MYFEVELSIGMVMWRHEEHVYAHRNGSPLREETERKKTKKMSPTGKYVCLFF